MAVIPFPRRVNDLNSRVPPLRVMAPLLMHESVWSRLDRFQCVVVLRGYQIALDPDADDIHVVEYMRYLGGLLNAHYFADNLSCSVGPSMGELPDLVPEAS